MSGFNPPAVIHETVMLNGVKKTSMPLIKQIVAGVISGFYVIIGVHGMVSLLAGAASSSVLYLLAGIIFATAIMAIIIAGGELFTGNCLIVVTALSGRITWPQVFRNWVIIYFSNFFGSIFFAVLLYGTGFYGYDYPHDATPHATTLCHLVAKKTTAAPAYQYFFRSIFANFCVCLAVMMSMSANNTEGKILGMVWPIMVFVLSGYEHSIANQGFFSLATLVNCPTSNGWYWMNLSVTTPGNMFGAIIIGVAYYIVYVWNTEAQTKGMDIKKKDDDETDSIPSVSCGQLENKNSTNAPSSNKAGGDKPCRCPSVVLGTPVASNAAVFELRNMHRNGQIRPDNSTAMAMSVGNSPQEGPIAHLPSAYQSAYAMDEALDDKVVVSDKPIPSSPY